MFGGFSRHLYVFWPPSINIKLQFCHFSWNQESHLIFRKIPQKVRKFNQNCVLFPPFIIIGHLLLHFDNFVRGWIIVEDHILPPFNGQNHKFFSINLSQFSNKFATKINQKGSHPSPSYHIFDFALKAYSIILFCPTS